MRSRSAQLTLTLVLLLLGAVVMIQFRTQGTLASAKIAESATDQTTIIANLANANDELRREAQTLGQQEAEYQRALEQNDPTSALADLSRLRVITGETEVSGSGIELRVSYPIRPEEVQDVVNEFRNAGAEALAVNGIRVVARSAVSASGDQTVLDGSTLDLPIIFVAIGDPDALDRALGRVGGMVSYLRTTYPSADITLAKRSRVTLPPTEKKWDLHAAEVVKVAELVPAGGAASTRAAGAAPANRDRLAALGLPEGGKDGEQSAGIGATVGAADLCVGSGHAQTPIELRAAASAAVLVDWHRRYSWNHR